MTTGDTAGDTATRRYRLSSVLRPSRLDDGCSSK